MDIYWAHVAQHRYRTFVDPDGYVQTSIFDPVATVAARPISSHVGSGPPPSANARSAAAPPPNRPDAHAAALHRPR